MTCKDCVCFERCRQLISGEGINYMVLAVDGAEENYCFKSKSRFIELPCKVGDTVYCILFSPKFNKLIVEQGFVESFKIGKTISARVLNCEVASYANVDIVVDISEFGKTVFLVPEEAKKALKEYEKNE